MKNTPLYDLHLAQEGKITEFAGYNLPIQYDGMGVMQEHLHTRKKAGLFDVSHMGQAILTATDNNTDPAGLFEKLCPSDIKTLHPGQSRYTVLLNENGGILDDLIIGRIDKNRLYLVVNAAKKEADFTHISTQLGDAIHLEPFTDYGLIALQGPRAEAVLAPLFPDIHFDGFKFMHFTTVQFDGIDITLSRSGYTGEDGFELSVPPSHATRLAQRLLEHKDVALIGLGARDSLRLEAGLCLYGHDLTEETTPVQANLKWVISKSRREHGGFIGSDPILNQLDHGCDKTRIGLIPQGRMPIREGTELFNDNGDKIGYVTSGGFSPSLGHPIAMGYVTTSYANEKTVIKALVRKKEISCTITKMPFVQPNYKRIT